MRSAVVDELVERYGTPLYVYRLDAVRASATALRRSLPDGVRLYYSMKANPHPTLAEAVAALGVDLEISSSGELAAAAAARVPAERCLYSGPAKCADELAEAVGAGVRLFSVESPTDLGRLVAAARHPVEYLIRLGGGPPAAGAGLRMTGVASQFGVDDEDVRPGSALLAPAGSARPVGWHVFAASNLRDEPALLRELSTGLDLVVDAQRRTGFAGELIDLGGGFGAPFAAPGAAPAYPALRDTLTAALDRALPGWRRGEPRVAVESGRHLVAAAGTLLTTVMDRKRRGGRTYVLCDGGVNALGGMSGLGRLMPPAAQPESQTSGGDPVLLTGPLCTPLDLLSRAAGTDAKPGEVLRIPNVGAYGLTASLLAFLGRPAPAEVVLDGEDVVAARRLTVTGVEIPTA